MLNTSLHNPSVRDKPSLERFIQMNRGINEGKDLPEELLKVLTNIVFDDRTPRGWSYLQIHIMTVVALYIIFIIFWFYSIKR